VIFIGTFAVLSRAKAQKLLFFGTGAGVWLDRRTPCPVRLEQSNLTVGRHLVHYTFREKRLKLVIPFYTLSMRNEFTAVIERDNEWFVAWSPEIPGANGQGRSVEECRESLGAAIQLILEDRREDGLRGAPADALRETVTIQ
jgi:predicted RNase H-like HicB family nuclease